ncbi:hypothetical protein AB0F52_25940 [Amycolatopsis sp. NPDC024027]|uniref:hypothetical protein n=1 Tax=Amycolatopsis sp. NPDC024027 TaxID=3154327 RepID=UPI0033FB0569
MISSRAIGPPSRPARSAIRTACSGVAQIRSGTARRDRRPRRLRQRTGLNGISRSSAASVNSIDSRLSCELTVAGAYPARSSSRAHSVTPAP